MITGRTPAGYVRITASRRVVVTLETHAADATALLADGSLYEAAARTISARPMQGRGIAYAIALPVTHAPAVVRHNRHGGFLAGLTRDVFLPPSRAPYELLVARRLADAGVPTPVVIMYGLTPAAGVLCRSDVVTREIVGGRDLSSYMLATEPSAARANAWAATRELVGQLAAAGARHHDLNVRNVLLAESGETLMAYALDVDRVTFGRPNSDDVMAANSQRLLRSARKWRDERGAVFDERDVRG